MRKYATKMLMALSTLVLFVGCDNWEKKPINSAPSENPNATNSTNPDNQ